MPSTERQRFERKIERLTAKLQNIFELDWISIEHVFEDVAPEDSSGDVFYAISHVLWEYRSGVIRWIVPNLIDKSDDFIIHTACHELAHVIMAPIQRQMPDDMVHSQLIEMAVENTARALQGALEVVL